MMNLKVTAVGNSLGVVLSKEAQTLLRVKKGDRLFLTEATDGARLTAYDPEFQTQMDIAEKGMARYRNTLKALAK